MNSQKGFVIPLIITIVAILAIGGGLYYYANNNEPFEVFRVNPNEIPLATTTDETKDWKTYTNTEYGYSFKYPATLVSSNGAKGISLVNTTQCISEYSKPNLGDNYIPTGCYSLSVSVQESRVIHEGLNTTKTSLIIGGIQGEKIVTDDGSYFGVLIQVNKDNQWYKISGSSNYADKKVLEDRIKEILITFKFTNSPTSSQPSVTVLSPNGGEVYKKGDTVLIRWNDQNIDSIINIHLLKADGTIYYNLGAQINPETGSQVDANGPAYSWWIPTDDGPGGRRVDAGTYKISISVPKYSEGMGIADMSDNYFTITN